MLQISPGPYAPPPYGMPAAGHVYFKVLPGIRGIAGVWREALLLYRDLGTVNHPAAPQKRRLLARHIAQMEERIKAGELAVAQATDEYVGNRIKATQRRPNRRDNMLRSIESRPIPYPDLPAFAVGQVDLTLLDRATTGRSGKPYWRTQEFGYRGHIGRRVRGVFNPGGVAPDSSQFRVHPIFAATKSSRIGSVMNIQKPIEERAFLRSGTMQAALLRQRMWAQMERQAVLEVRRILTFGGPGLGRRGRP